MNCRQILTFRQRLLSTWGFREELLAFRYRLPSETNSFLGIEDGSFPNERLDTTSSTINLVERDLTNNLGSVVPTQSSIPELPFRSYLCLGVLAKLLDLVNLLWQLFGKCFLQGLQSALLVGDQWIVDGLCCIPGFSS